jgi:hypothetical protein
MQKSGLDLARCGGPVERRDHVPGGDRSRLSASQTAHIEHNSIPSVVEQPDQDKNGSINSLKAPEERFSPVCVTLLREADRVA